LWASQFPAFVEKIRLKLAEDRYLFHPAIGQCTVTPGVKFAPGDFSTLVMGDCSDWRVSTPKSGPDGDYIGAARKPNWYIFQRAFFGGHNHWHAVKTLHYSLPNGLSAAMFGPVTSRRNNNLVIGWSDLDNSIVQLNQQVLGIHDRDQMFKIYYDCGIRGNNWICHLMPHAPAPNAPLTDCQRHEKHRMSAMRVTIEWGFDQIKSLWTFTTDSSRFKMETDPNIVNAQLRVATFLTNCFTCLNGNNMANYFKTDAPTLHEYLTSVGCKNLPPQCVWHLRRT
jgi:hypothetical protein